MRAKIKFRIEVVALALLGALILVLSLHGRHRPTEDHDILPTVPSGPQAPIGR